MTTHKQKWAGYSLLVLLLAYPGSVLSDSSNDPKIEHGSSRVVIFPDLQGRKKNSIKMDGNSARLLYQSMTEIQPEVTGKISEKKGIRFKCYEIKNVEPEALEYFCLFPLDKVQKGNISRLK